MVRGQGRGGEEGERREGRGRGGKDRKREVRREVRTEVMRGEKRGVNGRRKINERTEDQH